VIGFSPDLQFSSADRVRAHVEEAVAVYLPAAVVFDGSRIASTDSTGAAALLAVAADVAELSSCVVVACNLSVRDVGVIVATGAPGARVGKGAASDADPLPAATAVRAATSAGISAVAVGALVIVRSLADAEAAALLVCSAPRVRAGAQKAEAAGEHGAAIELSAPLLHDEAAGSGPGSSSAAGAKAKVLGVPLSPQAEAVQAARRARLAFAPAGEEVDAADAGAEASARAEEDESQWARVFGGGGDEDGAAGCGAFAFAEVRGAVSEAAALFDESAPMLVLRRRA